MVDSCTAGRYGAGKRVDVLICEKIFNRQVDWDWSTVPGGFAFDGRERFPAYRDRKNLIAVPDYSTDHLEAGEIINKLQFAPYKLELLMLGPYAGHGYYCAFTRPSEQGELVKAETEALAICLAALKAVEAI